MMPEREEKIRVLLVDDIPETRENLRKLLYFEKDIEIAGVAVNGEEAIALAKELQPNIVLLDINMPGMDGITAGERITALVPTAQIIMMSVQGETDYLQRSMLAGAKGFLIKPFSSDEMMTTIRRVYNLRPKIAPMPVAAASPVVPAPSPVMAERLRPEVHGKILAVYSPKGGVGCSLLATNLAIALRGPTERKIVLVDCSLQFGDVGVLLNLVASHTMAELADKKGSMDRELLEVVLVPHISGIKALLAPPSPEQAELLTAEHIRELLTMLRSMFDYIVVDVGSSLQDLSLAIFDLADRILLVTTPDIPAVKDTKLFFEVIEALRYPEAKIKLIVNRADRQSGIGAEEIAAGIRHPVFLSILADDRAAYTAVNQGIPCILNNRSSPIAQGALKLAQLITQDFETPAQVIEKVQPQMRKESSGLLSRLLGK